MTHWYLMFYNIFIFGTIIFLNVIQPIFALSIIQDQQRIENSLHDFMASKNVKTISVENVSSLGKRLIGKFSICGLSHSRKLNLCKRAMVEEDYFENVKIPKCKPQAFHYTVHFDDVEEDPEISMYCCPKLLRRNPETRSLEPDNRRLFIRRMSSGIEQAMVYIREQEGGKITLARHLVEITKSDLDNPPPPLPPDEIRSINRFSTITAQRARDSRTASPTRDSPQYLTAPNSPGQIASNSAGLGSSTEITSLTSPAPSSISKQSPRRSFEVSQAPSSTSDKSPSKGFLSGITPSMALGPLFRVPPNMSLETSRQRKKSLTSGSSPLHPKSASGSGSDTPFLTPSQSPLHPRVQTGTQTRYQKRPTSLTIDPNRPNSSSTSMESTEDSSAAIEQAKKGVIHSSRRARVPRTDDASGRAVNSGTGKLDTAITGTQAGPSKKKYRYKNINDDRQTRSETNSPQNEDSEFPGFKMPPTRTTLYDFLSDSPESGIQRTQSDNVLGANTLNQKFPIWPKRQSSSIEGSEEDSKGDSSSDTGPNKSMDPTAPKDIISEWREHRKRMQMKSGANAENSGETSATIEEYTSLSPLNKANIGSAYDKNVERHHTDKPTVLSAPVLAYSDNALKQLKEQESSEELAKDWVDTSTSGSASGSLPATKDFSTQADLPEEYDHSIQTDLPGDEDTHLQKEEEEGDDNNEDEEEKEGVSGTIFPTVATELSEEASKEGKTVLSQSSTKILNTPSGALLSTGNDESKAIPLHTREESDQAIQPATKDKSIQVDPPVNSVVSVGIQVDSSKLDTTTAVPPTSVDILQQTDVSPENTSFMLQTNRNTADQVDKSGERSNIEFALGGIDTLTGRPLLQALTEPSEVSSTSIGEQSETDEALVLKSTYQQTRPSSESLRNRSRSAPPPIRPSTIKVEEPEKDTTVLIQTSSGQTYTPANSENAGPSAVGQYEYGEPVVVKPVSPQVNISRKSLRRRFRSLSPTGRSAESGDISPRSREYQSTSSAKDESSSTAQKNEDQPPPKETDITTSQNLGILPLEQLESSQTPSDDSKKKE